MAEGVGSQKTWNLEKAERLTDRQPGRQADRHTHRDRGTEA